MSTVREHLEAIRDDIAYVEGALVLSTLAKDCHNHAVDALAILDAAHDTSDGYLLIPDPKPEPA